MFQFPWLPLAKASAWVLPKRVNPFGNPRVGLLDSSPGLIAVMPRPSSAIGAKASTLCPFLFNLHQPEHKTIRPIKRSIQFLKCTFLSVKCIFYLNQLDVVNYTVNVKQPVPQTFIKEKILPEEFTDLRGQVYCRDISL